MKDWTESERARLASTNQEELTREFPGYTIRDLIAWKKEAQAERKLKKEAWLAGKLSEKKWDVWVSQTEMQRRKRQEYNRAMGLTHDVLTGQETTPEAPEKVATYLTKLAQDEDKWLTQRAARSISLSAARELLLWKHIEVRLEKLAKNIKARPQGYAKKKGKAPREDRVLSLLWTDHHVGAALPSDELPVGYDEVSQRRRFAYILKNALEYKLDHRKHTSVNVYDAGDNMEGFLSHDMRSGEPLADQFATLLEYRIQATQHLAAEFPKVQIFLTSGNHDRNKMRHPGRATFQKWDSYQTMLGFAWRAACRGLKNVTFHIPKRPYIATEVLGHWHFITHGDTHLNFGNPGTSIKVDKIVSQANSINATQRYGGPFKVFAGGHVHTSVQLEIETFDLFINGALCPTSNFADAAGYHGAASQWMWETTERYSVGDMRRVSVDPLIDVDSSLDALIVKPEIW